MKKYEVSAELKCLYKVEAVSEEDAIEKAKKLIDSESDSNISKYMFFNASEKLEIEE